MEYAKKLIEVALPLDAINKASAREKSIRHGHPSTLHLWWARRPLGSGTGGDFFADSGRPVRIYRYPPERSQQETGGYLMSSPNGKAPGRSVRPVYDEVCRQGDPSVPAPGPEPTFQECTADIERERLFRIIEDLVLWENTTNETVLQQARDEIWQSWRRAWQRTPTIRGRRNCLTATNCLLFTTPSQAAVVVKTLTRK